MPSGPDGIFSFFLLFLVKLQILLSPIPQTPGLQRLPFLRPSHSKCISNLLRSMTRTVTIISHPPALNQTSNLSWVSTSPFFTTHPPLLWKMLGYVFDYQSEPERHQSKVSPPASHTHLILPNVQLLLPTRFLLPLYPSIILSRTELLATSKNI